MNLRRCTSFLGEETWLPKERFILRPAAYALVTQGDAILLVTNRASGRFYLPGGGVELGESLAEAVVREVREEAGIDVVVTRLVSAKEDFLYYDPTDTAYHGLLFYYQATPLTLTLPEGYPGNEDEGHPQWVPLETVQPQQFHNHGDWLCQLIRSL